MAHRRWVLTWRSSRPLGALAQSQKPAALTAHLNPNPPSVHVSHRRVRRQSASVVPVRPGHAHSYGWNATAVPTHATALDARRERMLSRKGDLRAKELVGGRDGPTWGAHPAVPRERSILLYGSALRP